MQCGHAACSFWVCVWSAPIPSGVARYRAITDAGASFRFELTDSNLNNTPDRCEVVPTYDADGNLLSDDRFTYTWDAENRLVRVEENEPDPSVPFTLGRRRVTYTYDFMGRRVRSLYERENILSIMGQPPTPPWLTDSDTRYVYDGWNVVLELDGANSNAVAKQYTWGLDLSGTLQGAGGVGGLLACKDHKGSGTGDDVQYVYAYDANGNVMALTDSSYDSGTSSYPGTELARYDYDPYGNVVSSTGAEASNNLYRFSSKPQSGLTGLYYYGYRWYSAEWGRFISRDPIEERGGVNLYGFVNNNSIMSADHLGLWKIYSFVAGFPGVHEELTELAAYDISCLDSLSDKCRNELLEGLREGVRFPDVPDGPLDVGILESDGVKIAVFIGSPLVLFLNFPTESSLTYRSHRGDLQWWHAMYYDEKTPSQLRNKIIGRAFRLAQKSGETEDCREKGFLLGQVLHTIQDAFSRAHVERNELGEVIWFMSYNDQDSHKHGEADKETGTWQYNKARLLSRNYLEQVLCGECSDEALNDWIRQVFENQVLRFADEDQDNVGLGGPGEGFEIEDESP